MSLKLDNSAPLIALNSVLSNTKATNKDLFNISTRNTRTNTNNTKPTNTKPTNTRTNTKPTNTNTNTRTTNNIKPTTRSQTKNDLSSSTTDSKAKKPNRRPKENPQPLADNILALINGATMAELIIPGTTEKINLDTSKSIDDMTKNFANMLKNMHKNIDDDDDLDLSQSDNTGGLYNNTGGVHNNTGGLYNNTGGLQNNTGTSTSDTNFHGHIRDQVDRAIINIENIINDKDDKEDKLVKSYIYLLRTREFLTLDKEIYKVGRTTQQANNTIRRLTQYTKGSEIVMVLDVPKEKNVVAVETDIKRKFSEIFIKHDDGTEWFQGDVREMKKIIWQLVNV
jgi:hypothetical protein